MTRRLAGVADMSGDELQPVVGSIALALALKQENRITGDEIRSVLQSSGLDGSPAQVQEVARRLGATPSRRPTPGSTEEEQR